MIAEDDKVVVRTHWTANPFAFARKCSKQISADLLCRRLAGHLAL